MQEKQKQAKNISKLFRGAKMVVLISFMLIVAAGIALCFFVARETSPAAVTSQIIDQQETPIAPVQKKVEISSTVLNPKVDGLEWKEITHANFWKNPELFATPDYKFANIKFSYPSSWKFDCCGDTDRGSAHFIFSSEEKKGDSPYISIMDYSLRGCPSGETTCAMDKQVTKMPKEKYDDLVEAIQADAKVKPKKSLKGLGVEAFNYEYADEKGMKTDSYIFKTGEDVVIISFGHYDEFESGFIDDFLGKIEKDIN